MKSFFLLPALLLCFVAASQAQSRYAGKYFGVSTSQGDLVAGVDLEVKSDGAITGRGSYIDLTKTNITGQVAADGAFTITERHNGSRSSFSGRASSNGKTLKATLSTGNEFVGKKITGAFPEAGIYHARTDYGDVGLFLVNSDRSIIGLVYDADGNETVVRGSATTEGFSGTTDDGLEFVGTFGGATISGTYSYGADVEGTFSGAKF